MLQKRCPGRRTKLTARSSIAVCRYTAEDMSSCRRRNRKRTMSAVYMTTADMYRRSQDLFRRDHLHKQADAGYVSYGIHSSDLVKVYIIDRDPVSMAFGLSYESVYFCDIRTYLVGYIKVRYYVTDLCMPV